jgi:hypothetical protein
MPVGIGYTSGKWYCGAVPLAQHGTANMSANYDYFVPFLCRKTTTFDRIALYNTGAVTINFRLGIYADDGGGHPGALVVDGGQLTTSGAAGDNAATISATLTGGQLYWLAGIAQTTFGTQIMIVAAANVQFHEHLMDFALPDANQFGAGGHGTINQRSYAAFPSTSDAVDQISSGIPFIRLRAQ